MRRYLWDAEPVEKATIPDLISQSLLIFSEDVIGLFGVRGRVGEDLLGFCGIVRLGGMGQPELGYELTQEAWGKGASPPRPPWLACATPSWRRACRRVIAGADAENGASVRVI